MNLNLKIKNKFQWGKDEIYTVLIKDDLKIGSAHLKIEKKINNKIHNFIHNSYFKGHFGQILIIRGSKFPLMLVGLGSGISNNIKAEKLGGKIFTSFKASGFETLNLICEGFLPKSNYSKTLSNILLGIKLKSYKFIKYKCCEEKNNPSKKNINLICNKSMFLERDFKTKQALIDGIFETRDLTSEPANILHPEEFVSRLKKLETLKLEVEILDEKEMQQLGMNALLGVGKGSSKKSFLVVLKWNGGKQNEKPILYLGKGVCFDSGGISIKSSRGMEDMKWDMGGAAIVAGAMKSIALQNVPKNIIGVIGLVENMPDGNAQRPGDIVKSMSGKTIEILNTDAEGRLVLADAIHFSINKFKPKFIIDLATLTGAIIIALGHERAGLFSNDKKLSEKIISIGESTGDLVWKMPLDFNYSKLLKSEIADLKNIGTSAGSAIQAACFINSFVGSTSWAHLDVAGMVWNNKSSEISPAGATGWGVKLLVEMSKK